MPKYAPTIAIVQRLLGIALPPTGGAWADVPLYGTGPLLVGSVRGFAAPGQVAWVAPQFKVRDAPAGGHVWFSIASVVDGAVVRTVELDGGVPPAQGLSAMLLDSGSPDMVGAVPILFDSADLEDDRRYQLRLRYASSASGNITIDALQFGGGAAGLITADVLPRQPTTAYVPVGQSHVTTSGDPAISYPTLLEDSWAAKRRRVICCPFGHGGSSFADRVNEGVSAHLWAQPHSYRRNILLASGGYEDVLNGRTAAQVMADHETQADLARTYGYDYTVGVTPTGSTLAAGFTQDQLDELDDLVTLMNANAHSGGPSAGVDGKVFDTVVDTRADARLADPTDTTYYQVDQLHYTVAGATAVADLVEAATKAWVL